MNKSRPFLFLAACLALVLAGWPALRAEDQPASPPPPPAAVVAPEAKAAPAISAEVAAEKPAAPAEDKVVTEQKPEAELRSLEPAPDAAPQPAATKKKSRGSRGNGHADAPPFGNHTVSSGSTQTEAVSIFGNTTVDGAVSDAAVAVFGDTTVNGTVGDAAVSVLGNTTINGKVSGEAVAVFGDLVLGPDAEVGGQAVVVLGKLVRAPGAKIHGGVQEVGNFGPFGDFTGLKSWIRHCLLLARPLAIGPDLGWAWLVAACFLAFYLLLAALFPQALLKSVEVLEQRPGSTILAALLATLLTPVALLLLILTGIGIALVPFLVVGIFFATLFGKAAVLAWIGRRVTGAFGREGLLGSVVVAVLVGSLIVWLLYLVPVLGFLLYKVFGILGFGMVIYRLILSMKREKPPVVPAASRLVVAGAAAGMAPPPLSGTEASAGFVPLAVPPISAATLPRVGFWLRFAASLLDAVLVGMLCGFLSNMWHGFGVFPFWFAAYCVGLWATKGTTIGGIICGLKVVRLDDRPIDWSMALVRALGGFLSLAVAGLGFIWVSFDDDKQGWHDKIAGTTIVRVPKGTPLL